MINIILTTILFVLGVLVILLICPVQIRVKGNLKFQESTLDGSARLLLGYSKRGIGIDIIPAKIISFGKYDKPLFVKALKREVKDKKHEKPDKLKKSFREKYPSLKKMPVRQLIKSILKSIRWEEFSLNGKLGLSNPMQTGIIFGMLNAFKGLVKPKKYKLALKPAFSNKLHTNIAGTVHFRFSPLITAIQAVITYFKYRK